MIHVNDINIIDGTTLLNIKPYVPDFDIRSDVKSIGLLEKKVKNRLK